jgi:hypothetical protein
MIQSARNITVHKSKIFFHKSSNDRKLFHHLPTMTLSFQKTIRRFFKMFSLPKPPGPGRYKCKFTSVEDAHLVEVVGWCGPNDWARVASYMNGRSARQCRERWNNYVNPALENVPWTPEEDDLLEEKFLEFGTHWQAIATFFRTRSRNDIKCHWFLKQRRMERVAAAEKAKAEQPKTDGPGVFHFSLSDMVPIPIVPRGRHN